MDLLSYLTVIAGSGKARTICKSIFSRKRMVSPWTNSALIKGAMTQFAHLCL